MIPRHHSTTPKLLLAAAAGALVLLAVGAPTAAAAPAAAFKATDRCWLAVVNDWLDNNQVDNTYAIPCYTQAIQHLSQFPDVAGYSSAEDDIHNALLAAIRQDRGDGGGGGSSSSGSGSTPGTGPTSGGGSGPGSGSGSPSKSGGGFVTSLGDKIGPTNAQSVPLPLLVLAGLAVLLLLAAGGTWLARRLQTRRLTAAPAPARRS